MSDLHVLDEMDLDWVSCVVDVVERAAGQPWRVALDRLDDVRRAEQPHAPRRFAAVVGAIQRVLGGRARNAKLARATRALALGPPVFTAAEREARIAAAAHALELTSAAVEALLWSDLPRERPVELPAGRPSELEIAAFANTQLLQRAVCRAQTVSIRIWGDSGPVIRTAAAHGLLTTASLGQGGETVLDIVGPLALCHRTSVYGRALAGLVPLLAECARFELTVQVESPTHAYRIECASPVLLPAVPARLGARSPAVLRLARAIQRLRPELAVVTAPEPLAAGSTLLCPDLVIESPGSAGARSNAQRCGESIAARYVELVGFWTTEYVQRKLARYRAAGLELRLCLDEARSPDDAPDDPCVVRFTKHVDAARVLA